MAASLLFIHGYSLTWRYSVGCHIAYAICFYLINVQRAQIYRLLTWISSIKVTYLLTGHISWSYRNCLVNYLNIQLQSIS
ncbi:hypothetical protein CODIS_40150 [Candidatus Thiodiazotropha endolucinida]|uniref:Uncharacterized protein n=1 Tax=Candidatus Thiodiazotropha endolucinida TaxID=1655433 RepID=A0A7Z0VHR7_9GAMM|nr:hypothetical protein CODIS_40150 [Candidatus Thiodiazotropha endolucinida]